MNDQITINGVDNPVRLKKEINKSICNIKSHLHNEESHRVFVVIHPEPQRGLYSVRIMVNGLASAAVTKSTNNCLLTAIQKAQKKIIIQIEKHKKRNLRHRKWREQKELTLSWGLY